MRRCLVCLAADNADPSNLAALVRWYAVENARLTGELLGPRADAARLRELEEIVSRQNAVIARLNQK